MKKYLFAISFFCLAFLLAAGEIVITGPGQIFVGSMVHFQFNPAQEAGSSFRWDFGDGSVKENGLAAEKHGYNSLGRFLVKSVDFNGRSNFTFRPGSFKPGDWIYWQVRLLNESKQVQTTSEIAAFKLERMSAGVPAPARPGGKTRFVKTF